jgi:hypothetical protein
MASIRREFLIASPAEDVWDAVRDFGAVHRRLATGFVVDAKMDGDARIVTFANGMVAREVLVSTTPPGDWPMPLSTASVAG